MRKIALISTIALAVALTACQKKEEAAAPEAATTETAAATEAAASGTASDASAAATGAASGAASEAAPAGSESPKTSTGGPDVK